MALPTVEQIEEAGVNMDTTTEEVKSQADTLVDQYGETRKTMRGRENESDAAIAKFNADAATAIANSGYDVIGDFADVTKVAITSANQVYTSTSLLGKEQFVWKYTGVTIPYTPTGSDPTQGVEQGKWLAVAIGELEAVAIGLNVSADKVGYADPGLIVREYMRVAEQELTYAVPAGAQGKTIVSVVNDALLVQGGGTYTLLSVTTFECGNVEFMKTISANNNDKAITKGYYAEGDRGGGEYVFRAAGTPIAQDALKIIHPGGVGGFWELQFDKELNYLQAGGVGDWDKAGLTGTDNTPILQNAIDYLYPFEWQGTVAATNSVLRTFRAAIFIPTPESRYMLSDVVMLNPNTALIGVPVARTFGMDLFNDSQVGSFFVPNFGATKQTKYVFDAAPFNASGVRVTSTTIAITNSNLDNAEYTAIDGVRFENILVCPDVALHDNLAGDIHFSPLRLVGASHRIKNNYFAQTIHGPSLQACWDYDYDGNLMQTFDSALSIFEGTVGDIGGINYCNSIGDRVRYGNTLPPWWVGEDAATFVSGDFDQPTSLVIRDVTSGRVSVGTWIQEKYNRSYVGQNASFFVNMAHSESINESLVALKGCNVEFRAGKTFLPSNRLFKPIGRFGGGSKVTFSQFDFGCTGPLASYIENSVEINIMEGCKASNAADGTINQGIVQTTTLTHRDDVQSNPSVYYEELDRRLQREIFVNVLPAGLGNDSYYGYDDLSAISTLEEALNRVKPGQNVVVKLRNSSTSTTSETFLTQPVISDANVSLSLRFNDRTHTVNMSPLFINSTLRFGNGMIFTGQSLMQLEQSVGLHMTGNAIVNISSSMFTLATGKAASLTLLKSDTSQFNGTGAFNSATDAMSVNLVNASSSSVEPAGGWGAATKVI